MCLEGLPVSRQVSTEADAVLNLEGQSKQPERRNARNALVLPTLELHRRRELCLGEGLSRGADGGRKE